MANEQFLKYLSNKHNSFWNHIESFLDERLSPDAKSRIVTNHFNDDISIKIPMRINALLKAGILNELLANELKLINSRGNNIAHHGISGVYSTCYHSLETLGYLNKYCK